MYDNSDNLAVGYALGRDANGNNGNNMWGDGSWIWAILILAFMWGGWGGFGGFGGGFGGMNGANAFLPYAIGNQGALTRNDLCEQFSFNDLQNGVRNVNDSVNVGFANLNSTICHQQYDTAMLVNGVNANLNAGFAGVNNAVCTLGYQNAQLINGLENTIQGGFNASNIVALQNQNALQAQLAQCCCENREGQAQIRYDMATNNCAILNAMNNNTRDIIDNQTAGTRAILDYLCQEKIADLQNENQTLKLAASQERQNNYLVNTLRPMPSPAYITCNPFTGTYGYNGYNNGCGCGCGC